MTNKFLLSGSGGQGVITMAILLAQAAALYEGRVALQSQSYGPEARGGATRSDVIISDEPILYPKVHHANSFVALTQEASNKYLQYIRPNGLFLFDSDMVRPSRRMDARYVGLPMNRTVLEHFHKTQVLNICVLGALLELTKAVSINAIKECLKNRFAKPFHSANEEALALGVELARDFVAKSEEAFA